MSRGLNQVLFKAQELFGRSLIYEIILSVSMASGVGAAFVLYVFRNLSDVRPANDSGYYFLRAAVRVNDLFHVPVTNAISVIRVARNQSWEQGHFGEELTILITVLGFAAGAFLLIGLLQCLWDLTAWLRVGTGLSVFFAAPIAYLTVSALTWDSSLYPFWKAPLTALFAGEVLGAAILIFLCQVRRVSVAVFAVLFSVNVLIWTPAMWPNFGIPILTRGTLVANFALLCMFPACGVLWLLAFTNSRSDKQSAVEPRSRKSMALYALALLLPSALIWFPQRNHRIRDSTDISSSAITLKRGPCYGTCPSYDLTIHANGNVEYFGWRFVRTRGQQNAILSKEQVDQVWSLLDRVGFLSLEDRAFRWCFDTSSISVAFHSTQRSKTVSSDTWCTGPQSGVQAKFVEASAQIDKIVGTEKWVRCDGDCR